MFVMAVTVTYCIGDLESGKCKAFMLLNNHDRGALTDDLLVLSTPTGYPYIQIFYNVTGSLAATNAMTALILILGFFGNVTVMAGSSRQLFAFARDEGMPFSKWIAKVRVPWNCDSTQDSRYTVLTIAHTDPSRRQRPCKCHLCHIRPRRRDRAHQPRQHSRFQHRNLSRHRHSHGVIHHLHFNHHLAKARRRATLAITIQHGRPCVRSLREHGCTGVALLGVCDSFLPQCACSAVDNGSYELVGCCFLGRGGVQCGILCCLGEEELCWACRVR